MFIYELINLCYIFCLFFIQLVFVLDTHHNNYLHCSLYANSTFYIIFPSRLFAYIRLIQVNCQKCFDHVTCTRERLLDLVVYYIL